MSWSLEERGEEVFESGMGWLTRPCGCSQGGGRAPCSHADTTNWKVLRWAALAHTQGIHRAHLLKTEGLPHTGRGLHCCTGA